jgi:succinate dehydrogenase / fumarate reductase, flavoprotein subunit
MKAAEVTSEEGEALRVDDQFSYVAAWEFSGDASKPNMHKEALNYENIKVSQRSYK